MTEQLTTHHPDLLRVLIIEDDVLYATIIGEMLREGTNPPCQVTLEHTAAEGKRALAGGSFSIILLDLHLADGSGESLVRELQAIDPRVPILVMTGTQNEAVAASALQAGAQDYLVKGSFKVQDLTRSIRYARERHRLRLELEQSLRQRLETVERGFRRLIDENADGILVVRPSGRICFTNPQVEAIFEQKTADLLGQVIPFSLPKSGVSEIKLETNRGEIHYMELRSVAIDWEDEPAFLLSLRDITARKQQQGALQNYANNLRTQNEDLEAYARMVAHDLKSPLGILVGYAETLKELHVDLNPDQLADYLALIARSGRKLEAIINELLLLASVRQEKVDIRPLDMAGILAEVRERLAPMIEETGTRLALPSSWPAVLGYAPWVEEVWINYLSNAIKYGGRPPRITLGHETLKDGMVRFLVQDNGPGISPQDQKKLFTQFPQMSQIRVDGHGLGLSIVRRIVSRLGGQVGVSSMPGRGSIFTFTLPAVTQKAAAAGREDSPANHSATSAKARPAPNKSAAPVQLPRPSG